MHGTNVKKKMKIMFIVISAPCCVMPTAITQREAVCSKVCHRERLCIRKSYAKLTQRKYNTKTKLV